MEAMKSYNPKLCDFEWLMKTLPDSVGTSRIQRLYRSQTSKTDRKIIIIEIGG